MLRRVVDNCDAVPAVTTGDAGYVSADNVLAAEHMGTEPLISGAGHFSDGQLVESRADLPHLQTTPRAAMRARLLTPQGRAAYARRKATVEPGFGQIRSCRGFRQMSLRGLFKAGCEWLLVCATTTS